MTDIVERLRGRARGYRLGGPKEMAALMDDAADEIERLRAWNAEIALNALCFAEALREIAEHPTGGVGCNPEGFVKMARAALGKEEA